VASITFPIAVGGSVPGFGPSTRIGNNNLTPEFTTSYDGGINVGLFNGKVSLDVGTSIPRALNKFFNVAVSNSSGYDTRTSNVGLITNRDGNLSYQQLRKNR